MNRDELMEAVRREMPERRWQHTLGVVETSIRLAKRYGADEGKAETAAVLHDVAKYWPIERMEAVIREEGLPKELLAYDKNLWHAPVGAVVAERDYRIGDPDVLNAIRYHTSGRRGMSRLEKIVCLADYMEPGRDFPGVARIRALSENSLEEALVAGFDSTIMLLIEQGRKIYPLTLEARNGLLDELGGQAAKR